MHVAFRTGTLAFFDVVDLTKHVSDLHDLAILALDCGQEFLDARGEKFLDFLLKQRADGPKQLLRLSLLLLSLAHLIVFHELN